jgi:hypothetical protein
MVNGSWSGCTNGMSPATPAIFQVLRPAQLFLTLSIVASNPQDPYQAIKPTHQTRIRIDFRVPHTTIQHLRT